MNFAAMAALDMRSPWRCSGGVGRFRITLRVDITRTALRTLANCRRA